MLVKRPGENYMIENPERPFSLGQMRGISFDQKMIQLYQGSTVLLTSFGISEMTDENGSKYGIERLIGVMNRISGNVYDLDKTIIELEKDLETFRGEAPVSLDTAVLGFRYFG
jgi:serine phosphatase RsbU (regulator of sigma subunit)